MFHIIATKTVLPTLKSAREHNKQPHCPKIMYSGEDPHEIWNKLTQQIGVTDWRANNVQLCLNGLPIFVSHEWTYWLVNEFAN